MLLLFIYPKTKTVDLTLVKVREKVYANNRTSKKDIHYNGLQSCHTYALDIKAAVILFYVIRPVLIHVHTTYEGTYFSNVFPLQSYTVVFNQRLLLLTGRDHFRHRICIMLLSCACFK